MATEPNQEKYLRPVDDGLQMRLSGEWTEKKLEILEHYIVTSSTAMAKKPWRKRVYIDLQAGPGKNRIDPVGRIVLGSPLLALTRGQRYTDYRFVEQDRDLAEALWKRAEVTGRISPQDIIVGDCNSAVDGIVQEIKEADSEYRPGKWQSLCLVFLDPEGLELHWRTVDLLANTLRADFVINFSTGGLRRVAGEAFQHPESSVAERVNKFFGTKDWRHIPLRPDGSMPVNEWIDFYQNRLSGIGYKWGTESSVKIRTNYGVELYRLLFASKHDLGVRLWEEARKNAPKQRSMF